MISVEEALTRITGAVAPLGSETLPLAQGLGRVLAEDLPARLTQPPKDMSAMDGYAARLGDLENLPTRLAVVAHIAAGASFAGEIGPGQAARIFTGAPVPKGADCIVIQEDTDGGAERVEVREAPKSGQWIRPAGLDFAEGDLRLTKGQRLSARDIGLAAAMGHDTLPVYHRPRVAIISTGDELVMPGDPRGEDQIFSSNGFALSALIRVLGGVPLDLGVARDNRQSLERVAEGAKDADVLITAGGASVGEHDLVQEVLGGQGLELDFWRIAMRPGKPLMFGKIANTAMLGLPGNPVSALVCATLFLGPLLDSLQGLSFEGHVYEEALAGVALPENDRRQDYLRATLSRSAEGRLIATPFAKQDSSMLSRLAAADCLIMRPPHAPSLGEGAPVQILRLDRSVFSI